MNQGQFSGLVTEYEYSHTVKGVKIYQGKMKIERQSRATDTILFMHWNPDIEAGKFYSIQGELRTFMQEVYPKKKIYIKVKEIKELDEPSYVNELTFSGVLIRKNELRTTPFGRTIIEFMVADQTNYANLIAWGAIAFKVKDLIDNCKVEVSGKLQSREYVKDNSFYTVNEISCFRVDEVV